MESSWRRRWVSSLLVPVVVLVFVPIAVLFLTGSLDGGWADDPPLSIIVSLSGLILIVSGLILLVATIRLFSRYGEGAIMPWDPTQRLVVRGVYRHVRNPMHTGVFLALFGEGLLLRSSSLLILAAAAVVLHLFYIPFSEERGLEKRFGAAYREYKANVPRWIPRWTPWEPGPQVRDHEH
jgi:protein-S-isoprenylcysteine O-methyltransferase Ste14